MMKRGMGVIVVVLGMAGSLAWAQQMPEGDGPRPPQGQRGGAGRGGDPLMEEFFPPELVMQNQKAIGLTDDQQKKIRDEMQKAMARITDLQWQQSAEQEAMMAVVRKEPLDAKAVMAQLDKLLSLDNDVKRLQFGMLVTIKSVLTAEQAAKARELKRGPMPMRMGEGSPRAGDARPESPGVRQGQPEDRPREAPPATR